MDSRKKSNRFGYSTKNFLANFSTEIYLVETFCETVPPPFCHSVTVHNISLFHEAVIWLYTAPHLYCSSFSICTVLHFYVFSVKGLASFSTSTKTILPKFITNKFHNPPSLVFPHEYSPSWAAKTPWFAPQASGRLCPGSNDVSSAVREVSPWTFRYVFSNKDETALRKRVKIRY